MSDKVNIFQIWIEHPSSPDSKTMRWMRSVIENHPKKYNYMLISDNNYFDGKYDITHVFVNDVINEMLESSSLISSIWSSISVHQRSELLRSYVASTMNDCVYFDCDVELIRWVNNIKDSTKPYFVKNTERTIDNHAFFSNGKPDWFARFLIDSAESMKAVLDRKDRLRYSHTYTLINKRKEEVNELNSNFIIHHNRD